MNLENIWEIVNSPSVIAALAGVLAWLLTRLYAKKPVWQAYEGTIVSAIKWAEKIIPDNHENKSIVKLDTALRYVLDIYAKTGRQADAKTKAVLREGIQIKHAEMEASGKLKKPEAAT